MLNKTIFGEQIYVKENEDNLRTFKYSGSDASLLYKHVYGKIAQFLVDKVIPASVA